MEFNNDEYTLDIQALGDDKQIQSIRELILKAVPPFSIGLSGRWGSGKTSIMKYLLASLGGTPTEHLLKFGTATLEEKDKFEEVLSEFKKNKNTDTDTDTKEIRTIWFNPWENETHKEHMIGLLKEIHNYFSIYCKTLGETTKIASIVIQSGLDMLGSFFGIGDNTYRNINNIGEKYEYDNFKYVNRNEKFKFVFQEAIKFLLVQKNRLYRYRA